MDTQEQKRKKETFADRADGSPLDGYHTIEEFARICSAFFSKNNGTSLRDRASFIMSHYGALRGDNMRKMDLADLLPLELENEGKYSR